MKILLDANLSFRLVKKLADLSTECLHVTRTGLPIPASDVAIWDWAKKNGYLILVSNDEDFRFLLERFGGPPKVILLKTGNKSTEEIASILLRHKSGIIDLAESDDVDLLEIY
jgi:predicted nuclease of predicted toxin-antitoxin system